MTLTLQAAPKSDLDVLMKTLGRIDVVDPLAGGSVAYDVSEPVPVYTIDLETAAGGRDLSSAKQVAWRYLLTEDGEVATADVDVSAPDEGAGDSDRFNNMTRGRLADMFTEALHAAERIAATSETDYQLRVLEVPSLNMGAVWLERSEAPILIPYLDAVRLRGVLPDADKGFLDELRRRAILRLEENRAQVPDVTGNAQGAN